MGETRWTRDEVEPYEVFEGISEANGAEEDASLEAAFKSLWENAGPGKKKLRVVEIEMYGSNPIDMFRVIGTTG